MKRGFLNTPRYKRVIEEAYAPAPPPGPIDKPSRRGKPSSPSSPPAVAENVQMTTTEDVYADERVATVRVVRSAKPEDEPSASTELRGGETGTTVQHEAGPDPGQSKDIKGKDMEKIVDMDADPVGHNGIIAGAELPSKCKDPKGNGKEKAVDSTNDDAMNPPDDNPFMTTIPSRPSPQRPGWGRHPDEQFFHTVPPSHGGPRKKRAVFRLWPRDSNGQPLVPNDKLNGTLSPDGYPWGATLYDFYHVNRLPNVYGLMSIMTGSAISQAVVAMGELDAAAPEIEWAKSEGKPRVEGAADTEELIRCTEMKARVLPHIMFSLLNVGGDEKQDEEQEQDEQSNNENEARNESGVRYDDKLSISIPPPPTIPLTSPFHPSHYPEPWPFTPFENHVPILLQEHIPLYLLPQTLYIHDPFCLLPACERQFRNTSWTSRPDIIRKYNLHLSQSIHLQVEEARRKAEELEEIKARTLIILRYNRTKEQIENNEPMVEVPLPSYPRRMTKVEDSHLYLSPVAKVGQGHHSLVYKGEWELPRDLFMKQRICQLCFEESAEKEIQKLKATGRWEKMLSAAAWGPNGFTGRLPTQAELGAVSDPANLAKDGEMVIEREITCVVPLGVAPSQIIEALEERHTWDVFMKEKSANSVQVCFAGGENAKERDSHVAVIRIDPPFSYESQKSCIHDALGPVPRTATFTVAAKLSIENDPHLSREARNYQRFPEHFFHHYNGYTIIPQLHAIVPVNAVVPQFYGYYTPDEDEEESPGQPPYLSPILLLEHCGKPIDPKKLSVEDQEECVSLLLRFQRAGWLHESVAPRNFLVQKGKPTEFPLMRMANPELSFRLIDFGRSRKYSTASEKREEEMEALRMLERLNGRMGVTLW